MELFIDLYKFAGTWFLIMESSWIKYIEIEVAANQSIEHMIDHVTSEIHKYTAGGLQISGVHVDNQFYQSEFERAIKPAILIPYAANEHVTADRMRFGARINQVNAGVVLGTDQYPTDLDTAYAILTETQKQQDRDRLRQSSSTSRTRSEQGQSNYQNDRAIPDGESVVLRTDRRVFNVQCNRCNAWGHYASAVSLNLSMYLSFGSVLP